MGGGTYQGIAAAWIARSGDPYSDRINSMSKYVVPTTLRHLEWNNTLVISGDPIAEVRRLKHSSSGRHQSAAYQNTRIHARPALLVTHQAKAGRFLQNELSYRDSEDNLKKCSREDLNTYQR